MAPSASVQDLRGGLSHVRWIGGGSAAGKSTIAELLAERYGLRHVSTDAARGDHAARMAAQTAPYLDAFRAMDMDERWMTRSPSQMLETFHWFRGEGFDEIVKDLLGLPRSPGIVVDGFRLLPRFVEPLLLRRSQAIWLLPTTEFRLRAMKARGTACEIAGKTSDPPRAQANLLERDRLFTAQLDSCVRELDLPYVRIDGSEWIEGVASRLEASLGLS